MVIGGLQPAVSILAVVTALLSCTPGFSEGKGREKEKLKKVFWVVFRSEFDAQIKGLCRRSFAFHLGLKPRTLV